MITPITTPPAVLGRDIILVCRNSFLKAVCIAEHIYYVRKSTMVWLHYTSAEGISICATKKTLWLHIVICPRSLNEDRIEPTPPVTQGLKHKRLDPSATTRYVNSHLCTVRCTKLRQVCDWSLNQISFRLWYDYRDCIHGESLTGVLSEMNPDVWVNWPELAFHAGRIRRTGTIVSKPDDRLNNAEFA